MIEPCSIPTPKHEIRNRRDSGRKREKKRMMVDNIIVISQTVTQNHSRDESNSNLSIYRYS